MRRRLWVLAVGFGVLVGQMALQARDPYDRRGGAWQQFSSSPVDAVIRDLEAVQWRSPFVDRHERRHMERARADLHRFRERWRSGRFDRGRLDNAMNNIAHLVNARQLHPRDRQILARDLRVLRDFRLSAGSYGYRSYGYR